MKKIIVLYLFSLLSFVAFAQKKKVVEKKPAVPVYPEIIFNHMKHDFGNINERGGRVFHFFEFTNTGKVPLKIENVITGCGCTSTEWPREEIPAGAKGVIKATYDPLGRQGPFDKEIVLETNAMPRARVIRITGYVIPNKNDLGEMYKYQYGNIAVNTNTLNFNKVLDSKYDSGYFSLFNIGTKTFEIYKIDAPNNIIIKKNVSSMVPYSDMTLYVNFYPKIPVEYGPIRQEIKILTNDDTLKVKKFYINAEVVQDFSKLTKKQIKRAPKIVMETADLDFGDVNFQQSPEKEITIENKGKSDLIIRRIVRSCNCITPTIDKMIIKRGSKAKLKLKWDLTNMAGRDEKTFRIISNDPNNSDVELKVRINVVP
ncbi:MAG: DUF1573 domain-containing protein [Bacteroidia bacterium]